MFVYIQTDDGEMAYININHIVEVIESREYVTVKLINDSSYNLSGNVAEDFFRKLPQAGA